MKPKPGHEDDPLEEPPIDLPVVEEPEPLIVYQEKKRKPKYNNNGRLSRLRRKQSK